RFAAGDTNLYRYVHNLPTGGKDPSGTNFIAIADRPFATGYQHLVYHYSIEYWTSEAPGPTEPTATTTWETENYHAKRTKGLELLVEGPFWARAHFTFWGSERVVIVPVEISYLSKSSEGTKMKAVLD